METGKSRDGGDVSFLIRFWQEQGARPFWRGRVVEVGSEQSGAFEDARGLLAFVRARLREVSNAMLPSRRGGK
jgi:hypothetical protein